MRAPPGAGPRPPLAGVRMILRYNAPLYLAGLTTAATGAIVAASGDRRPLTRAVGAAAAVGAGWLAIASLAASWWVYDRSELYRWTWLARAVPDAPARVLVVHAGLDEASEPIQQMWPDVEVTSVDVHDEIGRTTASLRRARRHADAATAREQTDISAVRDQIDAVVAVLAAHEIRTADGRAELLSAIRDCLRPGGRLVVVEHIRHAANALVYGPAVLHFYSAGEWRRVIDAAGLQAVAEKRITPFVTLFTAQAPVADGARGTEPHRL